MKEGSKTFRRLGVAGLGAVIALGTSAVGFTGIAAAANSASLQIVSQTNNAASTLNDGTNATVKLSAVETQLPSTGSPDIASVRFSYTEILPTAGTITAIGSDMTAPFSLEWAPPSNGTYTITAEPLDSGGGAAGTPVTKTVVVTSTAPSVHISNPTDGSTVPFYNSDGANSIAVSGTRSITGGLPAVSIETQLRDDSTTSGNYGLLGDAIDTDDAVAAVASPVAGASQSWNAVVPVPTDCPAGDTCDVIIDAVAGATVDQTGAADEVVEGTLASSPLAVDSFTVTPTTTVNATTGATTTYTVTATAGGAPVPGVLVTASSNHPGTTTIVPASTTTGTAGTATFAVTDTASETSTLTFETELNGTSFDPVHDFSVTRTLVTAPAVTPVLTTIKLTKAPSQSVYASQSYSASYPKVLACLTDQSGNPYLGSDATVLATATRTIGNTTTTPTATLGAETSATSGCYPVTLSSYPGARATNGETTGTDTYDVYVEKNGTPGFQSGSDLGDSTTVNFAPGAISFDSYANCTDNDCNTQAQVGTVDSITVHETVAGSPLPAGQTLDLTLDSDTGADFPQSQPTGATRVDNTDATCTTDATGSCKVNVTDGSSDNDVELTATDTQDLSGEITIAFRNKSVALTGANRTDDYTLYPTGTTAGTSGTTVEDYGTPGTIMVDSYQLVDTSGGDLADIPVTVTVDHGFFTDLPTGDDYNTGMFTPAAAAGGLAGTPINNGTTLTGTTDANGEITFATSIGADASFNNDGEVLTDVKIASGGITENGGNPAGFVQTDEDYTWTTNSDDLVGFGDCGDKAQSHHAARADAVRPNASCDDLGDVVTGGALNGTSVTISAAPGSSLTGNASSGFEETHAATTFYVQLKDQFGNLVGAPTTVAESGAGNGELTCSGADGLYSSYTNDINTCELDSTESSPTTAAPETVTDTWATQSTTFTANSDTSAGAPAFVATVDDTVTKSDAFTIDLYSIDVNKFHYAYKVLPADISKTGTTVHDEVTVTDQYSKPVQGLFVNFDQSGPGAGVDFPDNEVPTNASGTASYNFSSATQGDATVTVDVYDCDFVNDVTCSGIPLSEKVNTVSFDGVPSIALSGPSHSGKVTIAGFTRSGASVTLHKQNGSSSSKVATETAQSDGSYSFTTKISKTTKFYVSVDNLQTSAVRKATVKSSKTVEKPHLKLSSKKTGVLKATATTDPKLKGATVHFYMVSGSGHRSSLGKAKSDGSGKATTSFDLTAGKTYTIEAKVTGLGKKYKSKYSTAHSKKVKG